MRQTSIYLRGENTSCLVRVPDVGNSYLNSDLARDKAQEMGIYPNGAAVLAYSVDEQDEDFYDRLITQKEAEGPAIRAKAR